MNTYFSWVDWIIGAILGCVFGFSIGYLSGIRVADEVFRNEAIKSGVGKWVIDEKTGQATFIFITEANNKRN